MINLSQIALQNRGKVLPLILPIEMSKGTGLCNPSILIKKNKEGNRDILLNIRNVQYIIYHSEFQQKFPSGWGVLAYLNPEDDLTLRTTNHLCKLDENLNIVSMDTIDTSKLDIEPNWEFIGLEDGRLVEWDDKLYISGVRRDIYNNGDGKMELSEVINNNEISRVRIETPDKNSYVEKNWMPILDMPYHYVKWANPLEIVKVTDINKINRIKVPKGTSDFTDSEIVLKKSYFFYLPRDLRGGSQVINWGDKRVAITHEVDFWHNENNQKDAHYYHRFIIWDENWDLFQISKPFKFMDAQIEFNAGLAYDNGEFLITYGYQDNAAYIIKIPENALLKGLEWEDYNELASKTPYTKNLKKQFKYPFKGLNLIGTNYSQCYQDMFVLSYLKGKNNGTFLEIGAGDPKFMNNTKLLEEFGWRGVSIDFNSDLKPMWENQRPHSNFIIEDATQIDYLKLIKDNYNGTHIDYLQLDVEPDYVTYNTLNKIPFDEITFGIITYEHDYYTNSEKMWRERSRKFLTEKGYILVAGNISINEDRPYEDWWVHRSLLNEKFEIITDKEVLNIKEYMLNGK